MKNYLLILFISYIISVEAKENQKNTLKPIVPKKSGVVESLLADIKNISNEIEKMKYKEEQIATTKEDE